MKKMLLTLFAFASISSLPVHAQTQERAAAEQAVIDSLRLHSPWQGETYTPHWWERYYALQHTQVEPEDTVFLGDSLTEYGGDWSGVGWDRVRNFGIVGDDIQGIGHRLDQALQGHPRKLYLMVGINDVSHQHATEQIVHQLKELVERIQQESPSTQLILQSLLPINESFGTYSRLKGKTHQIPEINHQLEQLAESAGISFLNLFPLFCQPGTHSLRADLSTDGLHLNAQGYEVWCQALRAPF